MSKLLQIVDVVFVSFNVKSEIHPGQLIHLSHVDVISEVVTPQVMVLFAMFLDSLQQLVKFLLPLEYIDLFRFNLFGFSLLKLTYSGAFPEIRVSLSLQPPSSLYDIHLFL